jgi:hypothetical protein
MDESGLVGNRTSLVTGVSDSSKELGIDEIAPFSKLTIYCAILRSLVTAGPVRDLQHTNCCL